jgi:hypothetical protein
MIDTGRAMTVRSFVELEACLDVIRRSPADSRPLSLDRIGTA